MIALLSAGNANIFFFLLHVNNAIIAYYDYH